MTLRITVRRESGVTMLHIDGRLEGEGVSELRKAVAETRRPRPLQLRGLRWADETGLQILRELRARGVALHGFSPYVGLLLDASEPGSDQSQGSVSPAPEPKKRRRPGPRGKTSRSKQ